MWVPFDFGWNADAAGRALAGLVIVCLAALARTIAVVWYAAYKQGPITFPVAHKRHWGLRAGVFAPIATKSPVLRRRVLIVRIVGGLIALIAIPVLVGGSILGAFAISLGIGLVFGIALDIAFWAGVVWLSIWLPMRRSKDPAAYLGKQYCHARTTLLSIVGYAAIFGRAFRLLVRWADRRIADARRYSGPPPWAAEPVDDQERRGDDNMANERVSRSRVIMRRP